LRRFGAKLGSTVLLVCLVLLAAANFIGAPLWAITLAAAVALVAGNWYQHYLRPWWLRRRTGRRRHEVCCCCRDLCVFVPPGLVTGTSTAVQAAP